MNFAPIARQSALAAALLAATCAAQAAIVISLTPFQKADTTWGTQVKVSGSVAANAAMTSFNRNFAPFVGTWSGLMVPVVGADEGAFGLLHGRDASANVNYDGYELSYGWTVTGNLGVPDSSQREIAGAPGGAFGGYADFGLGFANLMVNAGYVLGDAVSYAYTANSDIRNWAVDGAYASLKDANGLELFRIQVAAAAGSASNVPEPTSLALAGLALAGLGYTRRKTQGA